MNLEIVLKVSPILLSNEESFNSLQSEGLRNLGINRKVKKKYSRSAWSLALKHIYESEKC